MFHPDDVDEALIEVYLSDTRKFLGAFELKGNSWYSMTPEEIPTEFAEYVGL